MAVFQQPYRTELGGSYMTVFIAIQTAEVTTDAGPEIGGLAMVFMLTSMAAVVLLMVWCFYRLMNTKGHFDPDGTGPAQPPVKGRTARDEGI
jgi:hypothetical protein